MYKFWLCVIGCFCVVATPVMAMDLSLASAVDNIIAQSQDIKKADANVKSAQAQLDAVNANRWFNVSANASYMNLIDVERPFDSNGVKLPSEMGIVADIFGQDISKLEIPDNIFMAGVKITQPIYTFGKIGHAVDSVRTAIAMQETNREITRREVAYSAADLYWTAKMTDEIVKLTERDLQSARQAKNNIAAVGRANRSNLVKIESDIAAKEINLADAKFNRDTAHRMLKILAGIDVDTELNLTDQFPTEFAEMNQKQLTTTPKLEILNRQVNMYESQAKSKRADSYPTLAAMGSYSYTAMNSELKGMFNRDNSQSAYWGLALEVPIFTGGLNRANATVSAMSAESARQDLDKAKLLTNEEYARAIDQYNHLRGNLKTLQNARDLAAKAYKFSEERFAAGQTSAVELSEVSAGLMQLDMALLNSKYNILMSAESVKKLGE